MQKIEQGIYTRQQIIDVLHAKKSPRILKFRYDLLDSNENKKGELQTVESGEVKMSAASQIKRTARFRLKDTNDINWLSDRIQPFCMLKMPEVTEQQTKKCLYTDDFSSGTHHYTTVNAGNLELSQKTKWSDYIGKKWGDL